MINAFVPPVRDKIYLGTDVDIWKPAIWKNSRGKYMTPMAPHEAARYKEKTAILKTFVSERVLQYALEDDNLFESLFTSPTLRSCPYI